MNNYPKYFFNTYLKPNIFELQLQISKLNEENKELKRKYNSVIKMNDSDLNN